MSSYILRQANNEDIPFLAKTIMEAEKSGTEKFSFSTLFNKNEKEALQLIEQMLEEEIVGCEISINSFKVIKFDGKVVAAFAGWIETFDTEITSGLLKSNLIGYTFGKESIHFFMGKSNLLKEIQIKREPKTLQLEYLYVLPEYRGKKLTNELINKHINDARNLFLHLKKVQVQVFKNNSGAIKVYENCGFKITKVFKSKNEEILDYLPSNEKYLMEKKLN